MWGIQGGGDETVLGGGENETGSPGNRGGETGGRDMKRLILTALLVGILAFPVAALEPTYTSGAQTSDGAGWAHGCFLVKIKGKTDGTNDLTLKLYDNASAASGTVITEIKILGADNQGGEVFEDLEVSNGLYVDMTTSGTGTWWVEFKKK